MSLLAYLASHALKPCIKKTLFTREDYLLPWHYALCCQLCYDSGVALGVGFRDNILQLAKLFTAPGRELESINHLGETVTTTLDKRRSPPESLEDMCLWQELHETLRYDAEKGFGVQRVLAEFAYGRLQVHMAGGIGLGVHRTELAERLWRKSHSGEMWESEDAKQLIKAGLDVPAAPPKPVTLEEMKGHLITAISDYVAQSRPELSQEMWMLLQGRDRASDR